ncbi:MAG: LacI family transcriptional regulator [Bacillaceae bacterium]|nr:LacI family transcriptional regulator [Bacillaceae bacterium]
MGITIKDIAKQAGVSYSTVSKALRNSPLVKTPTKNKIIKIAEELGYIPNIAARSLVQKKSYTIGVVWPTVERVAPSALITKINELLEENSYTTLLSINKVHTAISTFNRLQVDAIIVFAEEEDYNDENKYVSKVPILYYGTKVSTSYPTIDVNRRLAIKLAVKRLIELGHEKIAFIGDLSSNDPLQKEKYIGYKEAIEEYGLIVNKHFIIPTNGLDIYSGYLAAKNFLIGNIEVTGIISGSFEITSGFLKATQELKIEVPKDVSVISYDNIPQTDNIELPFTKVGVPINRIAEQITETILDIIDGTSVNNSIILEPEVNIGKSCKRH